MLSKSLMLLACMFVFVANSLVAQTYIGAAKCKMCHNKETTGAQYTKWSESSHAKAYATLATPKAKEVGAKLGVTDPQNDMKCLKCHSTAKAVDAKKVSTITVEEGVSCESCHGPGSDYKAKDIMTDLAEAKENGLIVPTKEVCVKCHNDSSPTFKPFDFEARKKLIVHPKP